MAAGLHLPATRAEAACASGARARHLAVLSADSGWYDLVIAAGMEGEDDRGADAHGERGTTQPENR